MKVENMTKLNVASNELEKYVQNWLNEKSDEYEDKSIKSVLEDLFHGGCASGYVSELIYYCDTNKFYEQHKDDIWELLYDQSKEFGHNNIMEFISTLNGCKDVSSDEQFKNLLAWYAFEETARILANRAEIEI